MLGTGKADVTRIVVLLPIELVDIVRKSDIVVLVDELDVLLCVVDVDVVLVLAPHVRSSQLPPSDTTSAFAPVHWRLVTQPDSAPRKNCPIGHG